MGLIKGLKGLIEKLLVALVVKIMGQATMYAAGVVVRLDDKFVLVQEQHGYGFRGKWQLPMGRVGKEGTAEGALREGQEESGYILRILSFIGLYRHAQFILGKIDLIVSVYEAEVIGGELTKPSDLLAVGKFTIEEIEGLDERNELVSPYVLHAIRRVIAGEHYPMETIKEVKGEK